jgi:hypothetical protein
MFRSINGNLVCKIPRNGLKFVFHSSANKQGYVTGILVSSTNELYSPTLASLIQLGAYDVSILNEDRQLLVDE